jgi:hypothetical protein
VVPQKKDAGRIDAFGTSNIGSVIGTDENEHGWARRRRHVEASDLMTLCWPRHSTLKATVIRARALASPRNRANP